MVLSSGVVTGELFHRLYRVPVDSVQVLPNPAALTIKVTIPRPTLLGGPSERDFDGVQQFIPLLEVELGAGPQ
jgi:hypothetical protein